MVILFMTTDEEMGLGGKVSEPTVHLLSLVLGETEAKVGLNPSNSY